ncbi:hypothetical protein BASA61_002995 [Batrachochytrium salamandrivorans]|nr:hypothetical protein BASA61_002995 [Batrachochytrium salamandrivorans]
MGSRVENGKDGAETEVAQKSDGNEARKSTYTRVEDWLKLHPEDKPRLEQLRQGLADLLEQHFVVLSQDLDLPSEKDAMCNAIKAQLSDSYDKINDRNELLFDRVRGLYMLVGGELGRRIWKVTNKVGAEVTDGGIGKETRESKYRRVQEWFEFYPSYKTEFEEMKNDLIDWMRQHLKLWEGFLKSGCSTYRITWLSPEEMTSTMHLTQWYTETTPVQGTDEVNLMSFDKQ